MSQDTQRTTVEDGATKPLASEVADKKLHAIDLVMQLFRFMGDVPWVGLGAIGTGFGVALLYFYFSSISFVPADVTAILGASLYVALMAFALVTFVVLSIWAPLWAYRDAGLDLAEHDAGISALWALQLFGVGAFLLFIGIRMRLDCIGYSEYLMVPGALLAMVGLIGSVRHGIHKRNLDQPLWKRLLHLVWVICLSFLPFYALLSVLLPSTGQEWSHVAWLLIAWVLVVIFVSTQLRQISLSGCVLLLFACVPWFLVSLPTLLGHSMATQAAELAGIRHRKPVELRVPDGTCRLIQSALSDLRPLKPIACVTDAWGTVHGQVLSSLGDRWLVELKLAESATQGGQGALRVTIPAEGVQIVPPTVLAKNKVSQCGR